LNYFPIVKSGKEELKERKKREKEKGKGKREKKKEQKEKRQSETKADLFSMIQIHPQPKKLDNM